MIFSVLLSILGINVSAADSTNSGDNLIPFMVDVGDKNDTTRVVEKDGTQTPCLLVSGISNFSNVKFQLVKRSSGSNDYQVCSDPFTIDGPGELRAIEGGQGMLQSGDMVRLRYTNEKTNSTNYSSTAKYDSGMLVPITKSEEVSENPKTKSGDKNDGDKKDGDKKNDKKNNKKDKNSALKIVFPVLGVAAAVCVACFL